MNELVPTATGAASTAIPQYFSERDGPGDHAVLLGQLAAVIRQERAARGLLADSDHPLDPNPTDRVLIPEDAEASPPQARHLAPPLTEAAQTIGGPNDGPAPGAVPQPKERAAGQPSIVIRWGIGAEQREGEISVDRVESMPHRFDCRVVVGRWPTGQGAGVEVVAGGPLGRGDAMKLRWEQIGVPGRWVVGLFGVESVEALDDGARNVRGRWPDGTPGAITLPAEYVEAAEQPGDHPGGLR